MLTVRHITTSGAALVAPEDVQALRASCDGVLWIALHDPTPEEAGVLAGLGLHELTIEDILEEQLHPKIDEFPDHLYVVVHGVDLDEAAWEFSTIELDAILGPTWLVTHTEKPMDAVARVADNVERNPKLAASSARLLYELLDTMVDVYLPFLELIDTRIDEIDEELLCDRPSRAARDAIYTLRRDVTTLRRIALPQAEAVRRLAALTAEEGIVSGASPYFRDIQDKLARIADLADSYRDVLDSALDQYQSSVSNAQNEVMKVLTMVSAVLLPMTLVTGIYGMNFQHMPELDERWGYPMALGINVVIAVVVLSIFRWRGWVGRHEERRDLTRARELRIPAVGRVLHIPSVARGASRGARRPPREPDRMADVGEPG